MEKNFLKLYEEKKAFGKEKDKEKEAKLFLVTKPASAKDTAADILITVTAELLFTKFKEGLKADTIIGVFPNYIEASIAAKKAVGEKPAKGKKVNEEKESRFIVDMSFYVWAEDKEKALEVAKKIEEKTKAKYDNQCSVDKISLAPFGSMKTTTVWEK